MVAVEAAVHEKEKAEDREAQPSLGGALLFHEPADDAVEAKDQHGTKEKNAAVRRDADEPGDVRARPVEHAEEGVGVLEERALVVVREAKGAAEIDGVVAEQNDGRHDAAKRKMDGRAPVPGVAPRGEQRVEREKNDGHDGEIICDHGQPAAEARDVQPHRRRAPAGWRTAFLPDEIKRREQQRSGERVVEKNGGEWKERGAKREGQRGRGGGPERAAGQFAREAKKDHAAERGEHADGADGGEPGVERERPPGVGVHAERALEVVDEEVRGQRDQRGARRFVRMKMAGLRHVAEIARGADFDHRLQLHLAAGGLFIDRKKRPRHVHPRKPMPRAVDGVFRVAHRDAAQHAAHGVALVDEEIINGKAMLLDHGPHLGETGILIPPAALVEIGEGEKSRDKENEFETLDAGHGQGGLKTKAGGMTKPE